MLEPVQGRRRLAPPTRSAPSDEGAPPARRSPTRAACSTPTLTLLHDAGLVFEAHDRSLVARVQNHPLDILFVRTNDVVEFVNDGVADAGITGGDILAESGVDLPVLRELGYGRCRLAAAVPADAPYETIARPRRRAHRDLPPQRRPAGSSRTRASPSRSSRCRAPSRSPRGSGSRTPSWTSSRPAPRSR